jgi:hypothetical protein
MVREMEYFVREGRVDLGEEVWGWGVDVDVAGFGNGVEFYYSSGDLLMLFGSSHQIDILATGGDDGRGWDARLGEGGDGEPGQVLPVELVDF